jgi:cytochrome c556
MNRKWVVLGAAMVSFTLLASGLSMADDKESPLAKIMEKVQKNSVAITKATRTAPAFKKGQKEVVGHAEELVKLGKEAKEIKDAAKAAKGVDKPIEKWDGLMDEFIKSAEEFGEMVGKSGVTQPQAKAAYKNVSKRCTACHDVFKTEEDEFK